MSKIKFPKVTRVVDVGKDLEIEGYEGIMFTFWKDPSRSVLINILSSFLTDGADLGNDDAENFFKSVCELVVDCNIEDISFDTVEETKKSFDHPSLPWGFVFNVVVTYVATIIDESETIKKALGLSTEVETSGKDKKETEQ